MLHGTRLLEIFVILPTVPGSLAAQLVLLAWTLTELFRYPMFLLPNSRLVRTLRYLCPAITFPIGAGFEAVAAHQALAGPLAGRSAVLRALVWFIIPSNGLGGALIAYPGIISKALAALRGKL